MSFRLTEEATQTIRRLSHELGVSHAAVVEMGSRLLDRVFAAAPASVARQLKDEAAAIGRRRKRAGP
jgi:hypothetical protein